MYTLRFHAFDLKMKSKIMSCAASSAILEAAEHWTIEQIALIHMI